MYKFLPRDFLVYLIAINENGVNFLLNRDKNI